MFEVGSDTTTPSPPGSPDSAGRRPSLRTRRRSGDAAYHITEECERLFCETLKAVFLVEKSMALENSLVVGMRNITSTVAAVGRDTAVRGPKQQQQQQQHTVIKHNLPTPSPSPETHIYAKVAGLVREYVEVWDYAGGARFRGFVAEKEDDDGDEERSLFIFFDRDVMGQDLKPGLMALLELASSTAFACTQLIICVDRAAAGEAVDDVTRDLGWVGFELLMLDAWAGESGCISDRWVFLGMDV